MAIVAANRRVDRNHFRADSKWLLSRASQRSEDEADADSGAHGAPIIRPRGVLATVSEVTAVSYGDVGLERSEREHRLYGLLPAINENTES
jgi:hypothetical protein